MRPVTLVIGSRVKPGRGGQVRLLMARTFARIREEEDACEVLSGNQSEEEPERFLVYEEWSDREELERFTTTREHMQEYFAEMSEHVAQFERSHWTRFV